MVLQEFMVFGGFCYNKQYQGKCLLRLVCRLGGADGVILKWGQTHLAGSMTMRKPERRLLSLTVLLGICGVLGAARCIEGDLDGNGQVGMEDLQLFAEQWLDPGGCAGRGEDCADLTDADPEGDGNRVDASDFSIIARNWLQLCPPDLVITEVHYDADVRVERVEFVELFNPTPLDIDLTGYYFSDGFDYTFEAGVLIPAGGYLLVAENPGQLISKYGIPASIVKGPFIGKLDNDGEDIELRNALGETIDRVDYGAGFPWPTVGNTPSGQAEGNGYSIQLIHPELANDLGGHWRSAFPTPGSDNSVFAADAAPAIRQVKHSPKQPQVNEPIVITAKITDAGGVDTVTLRYQRVLPGSYIPAFLPVPKGQLISDPDTPKAPNPDFENPANWTSVAMVDDGSGADEFSGDGIYTATVTSGTVNRSLFRYRIFSQDVQGYSVTVPYSDDPSLNFACYVYNGVPDYVAETRSVSIGGAGHVYDSGMLTELPVYSLITREADMTQCIGYNSADRISVYDDDARRVFNWEGAFVYDGVVYDHVLYRLRGVNQRYAGSGKRSMRVRFNRGHYLQARDMYGKKFSTRWRTLNISKGCDNLLNQGNFGINEMINSQLFNMAGIPSPYMYPFHFRVIDGADEQPAGTNGQYYGDFWGLYFGVEDYDARFIQAHGLSEGNLYKLKWNIYDGNKQKRFQGIDSMTSDMDFQTIRTACDPDKDEAWLRAHVDLDHWYRYNTLCEMILHRDYNPSDGWLKNRAWFFELGPGSTNGRLKTLPHDTDSSWYTGGWNGNGDYPEEAIYADHPGNDDKNNPYYFYYIGTWPAKENLKLEHRNVMREFRDLLWTEEQIFPLLDDIAALIEDFVPADRDRWKSAPADAGSQDWGTMESKLASVKAFAFGAGAREDYIDNTFVNAEGDATSVPDTPMITYTGSAGYPVNHLTFETSSFSDPQGSGTFNAMKWRIAEVEPPADPGTEPSTIELVPTDAQWTYFKGTQEPSETGLWRLDGFNDNSWLTGSMPIGYDTKGTYSFSTYLSDMQNSYKTIYLRRSFEVSDPGGIDSLKFDVFVDDGCIIWINGVEVARLHVPDGELPYDGGAHNHGAVWETVTLSDVSGLLNQGDNILAVHALNRTAGSSDFVINVGLTAEYGGSSADDKPTKLRNCEIVSTWESDDITTFNNAIQIPGIVVKPGRTYRVRCKMQDTTLRWGHWSAPIEFAAGEALARPILDDLRVTEVMYNPIGGGDYEFIELKNLGSQTLDLSDVSFDDGVTFDFATAADTTLEPGEFILVVSNQIAFESRYGAGLNIAGEYVGGLSNGGESVRLSELYNGTIVVFEYNDSRGWPQAADGAGHSLVPLAGALPEASDGSLDFPGNFRQSTYIHGSPGQDDPNPPASMVINEIAAHTDYNDPAHPEYDSNDWIELYNPTGGAITLNGDWYLSDDFDDLKKWALPTVQVSGGGFVTFDEVSGFHSPITAGFGLNKNGEQVILSCLPETGQGRVMDYYHFKGQRNGMTLGRYPDGADYLFELPATRNTSNQSPAEGVVISELMYNPPEGMMEYIELYNPTTASVAVGSAPYQWRIDSSVDFTFPDGLVIGPQERLIIVGFDPVQETAMLDSFVAAYGTGSLTAGVDIVGPWGGALSNGGERVAIEFPLDPDLPDTTIPWVVVDEVIYGDHWPWPTSADGFGHALHRMNMSADDSGNDPANWTAADPTPGS